MVLRERDPDLGGIASLMLHFEFTFVTDSFRALNFPGHTLGLFWRSNSCDSRQIEGEDGRGKSMFQREGEGNKKDIT